MRKKKFVFINLFLLISFLSSCIPSQPTPQKPSEMTGSDASSVSTPPSVGSSPQPPAPVAENKVPKPVQGQAIQTSPPADKKARATVRFGMPGAGFPFSIEQTPLVDQEGFSIKGSFGLSGTITRPDKTKNLWVFTGQFELPSEEYKVGEVTYDILNAPIEYYTQKKPLPPSLIPQVMITIPIKLPPNAKDEKGGIKVPFRLEIPVPEKSQFLFTLIDKS